MDCKKHEEKRTTFVSFIPESQVQQGRHSGYSCSRTHSKFLRATRILNIPACILLLDSKDRTLLSISKEKIRKQVNYSSSKLRPYCSVNKQSGVFVIK